MTNKYFLFVITALSVAFWETNEEIKKTKMHTFSLDTLPFNLRKLEEIAKHNNGYLANSKVIICFIDPVIQLVLFTLT